MTVEEIKLISETAAGTPIWLKATVEYHDGRIYFLKSPFKMKDEIKAMQGSKWHGFEKDKPKPSPNAVNNKVWSISDSQRNRFQLAFLQNQNPYEWFDRELVKHSYTRPLMAHQCDLADAGLTYHFQIWANLPQQADRRLFRGVVIPAGRRNFIPSAYDSDSRTNYVLFLSGWSVSSRTDIGHPVRVSVVRLRREGTA